MTRSLAFLLVVVLLAVVAASAQADVVAKRTGQNRADVERYWNAKRMETAIPAERSLTHAHPFARPGGGGSGSTGGTAVEAPQPYPTMHGKVFFTDSGVNYVCSGTSITSSNQSVVWTAGHCVNEGPGQFYTNFMFVPAYRDGAAPYGKFAGTQLLTTTGWRTTGQFGVDEGAAVVSTNAAGQTLNQAVGGRSLVFNSTRTQSYSLYGYPAAGKFNGQRMYVCNTAWSRNDTSATPATMGVSCNMTGGSSGGGWVTGTGQVASVVSYGYSSLKNVLFGPHMETEAAQLFTAADSATP
jgi:hypothetical protein